MDFTSICVHDNSQQVPYHWDVGPGTTTLAWRPFEQDDPSWKNTPIATSSGSITTVSTPVQYEMVGSTTDSCYYPIAVQAFYLIDFFFFIGICYLLMVGLKKIFHL